MSLKPDALCLLHTVHADATRLERLSLRRVGDSSSLVATGHEPINELTYDLRKVNIYMYMYEPGAGGRYVTGYEMNVYFLLFLCSDFARFLQTVAHSIHTARCDESPESFIAKVWNSLRRYIGLVAVGVQEQAEDTYSYRAAATKLNLNYISYSSYFDFHVLSPYRWSLQLL